MKRPADQERVYLERPTTPCQEPQTSRAGKTAASPATSAAAACPSGPSAPHCSWPQLAGLSAQDRHCRPYGPSTISFP
jgi:hypothetical protein